MDRIEQAERIIAAPQNYKICCGCGSIVSKKTKLCPACHSYRYDNDPYDVITQAAKLSIEEQETVLPEDLY